MGDINSFKSPSFARLKVSGDTDGTSVTCWSPAVVSKSFLPNRHQAAFVKWVGLF